MKTSTGSMKIFILAITMTAWVACGHGHSHDHSHDHSGDSTTTETEKQGPEYTSAYICPMHCKGSGSAEPGKCPVCGMDYVKNEDSH